MLYLTEYKVYLGAFTNKTKLNCARVSEIDKGAKEKISMSAMCASWTTC